LKKKIEIEIHFFILNVIKSLSGYHLELSITFHIQNNI